MVLHWKKRIESKGLPKQRKGLLTPKSIVQGHGKKVESFSAVGVKPHSPLLYFNRLIRLMQQQKDIANSSQGLSRGVVQFDGPLRLFHGIGERLLERFAGADPHFLRN